MKKDSNAMHTEEEKAQTANAGKPRRHKLSRQRRQSLAENHPKAEDTIPQGNPPAVQEAASRGVAARNRDSRGGESPNKGRLYVGGTRLYGNGNILESDPRNYRGILQRVDELVATSKGRPNKSASGITASGHRENRPAPQRGIDPWHAGTFSLIYRYEGDQKRAKWQEMWRFISAMPNIAADTSPQGDPMLVYSNAETGINACFRGYCPQDSAEVGIEFAVSLPQPQCVAHEVLPVALRLLREFLVSVRVRTAAGDQEVAGTKECLLASWLEMVADERQRLQAEGETFFPVRSAVVDSVWEFQLLGEELQYANRHNECAFLQVEYVFRKRTKEVLRMCRWPELMPAVFPPVDLIMLVDPPAPLSNGRIVAAAEVFAKGKEWIKTEPFPITHKQYVRGEADAAFLAMLGKLKGTTMRSYLSVDWQRLDDR